MSKLSVFLRSIGNMLHAAVEHLPPAAKQDIYDLGHQAHQAADLAILAEANNIAGPAIGTVLGTIGSTILDQATTNLQGLKNAQHLDTAIEGAAVESAIGAVVGAAAEPAAQDPADPSAPQNQPAAQQHP